MPSPPVLFFKDLTTLLSEHASTRNEVFGIMREVHDGKVSRALGSGSGQHLKWRGHAGCIACATAAIDSCEMSAFGERWVRYRMAQLGPDDRFLAGLSAYNGRARHRQNREIRRRVAEAFLSNLEVPAEPPALTDAEVDRLIVLTDIGTRCRSAVGLRVFSERVRTAWRAGALVPGQPLVLADVLRDP